MARWLLLGLLVLMVGCGGGGGDGASSPAPAPGLSLTGQWVGVASSALVPGGNVAVTLELSQDSTGRVTGSYSCTPQTLLCLHASGSVSGTAGVSSFSGIVDFGDGHGCGTLEATFDSTRMQGQYVCSDTRGEDRGTFSLTRGSSPPAPPTGLTLGQATQQCSVESQPISCTNPGSQTVPTITPALAITFTEPMNRMSVERNVEAIVDNLTDGVSVRNTLEGLVSGQLITIAWNSSSTQLTVKVLKVARQLENGKSYRVAMSVVTGQCAESADGDRFCQGSLGPFVFQVRLP